MTAMLAVLVIVAVVGAFAMVSSVQRRADEAQRRADALAERNHRLERAVVMAEQALRSLSHDTRLDAGMAVEIDSTLQDIRRTAGDDDPPLGR